jgi:hypothetical protein
MKRLLPLLPVAALLIQLDRAAAPAPLPFLTDDVPGLVRALPFRDEGRFGRPGDTLNIVFVGSERTVARALSDAGWTAIPRGCADSVLAGLGELWRGQPLRSFPPMQAYRVMGRVQDMNWAISLNAMQTRHHFRLWRTGVADRAGREIWWGSGNFDKEIRWRDLSHTPDPDMSVEPAKLSETLNGSPLVESLELRPVPGMPKTGRNDNGYEFRHDGKVLVVTLKS